MSMSARTAINICAFGLLISGCGPHSPPGFKEQTLPLSTDPLRAYPALFSVDRVKMGFPLLPTNGTVRVLTVDRKNWSLEYPPPNYDIMFQFHEGSTFYPYSSRTVALKGIEGNYKWASEQVTFHGPKRYKSDDQLVNEAITITREVEQIAYHGTNISGTFINYSGPDKRLAPSGDHVQGLPVSQIGPVLREWGYVYDADRAQQKDRANDEERGHIYPELGSL
jgi:hypothetical protein